jgi:hypothetical protein
VQCPQDKRWISSLSQAYWPGGVAWVPVGLGVSGWDWLCCSEYPSFPGTPAKMPGLQISLMSEAALFRGSSVHNGLCCLSPVCLLRGRLHCLILRIFCICVILWAAGEVIVITIPILPKEIDSQGVAQVSKSTQKTQQDQFQPPARYYLCLLYSNASNEAGNQPVVREGSKQ